MRNIKGLKAILTGVFVLAAIVILIVGVFIIGGKDKTFKKSVVGNAIFQDINGLAKGSNVWYAGVKIGVVKKVSFVEHGVQVDFSIEEDVQQKIRMDTKVKLSSDGLIGNKILVLFGGTPTSPEIQDGNTLQVDNGLAPEEMLATLQSNNKNLLAITTDLKEITKALAEGKGTVGKLINDPTLSNSLNAAMVSLSNAGKNAQVLTGDLANFSHKLNSKGNFLNDMATDTSIMPTVKNTVAQLKQISQTANEVVENLNATAIKLNRNKTAAGVLLNDEEAAYNLQQTLANLNAGTHKLDENMEALQHNFLLRGFFKKKEKAEQKRIKDSLEHVSQPTIKN